MLRLKAHTVMQLMEILSQYDVALAGLKGPMANLEQFQNVKKGADDVALMCESLELTVSARTARQTYLAPSFEDYRFQIRRLRETIMTEMQGREFYGPAASYAKYFEQPKLFGDEVFDNFPSANEDIYEAGGCLALERSTACVMHLMRATEVGLKALAKVVNVLPQNDWGGYIREIKAELERRAKTAGARTPDEQFYSEAVAQIDNVKRAWRNPTMHVDRTYTQPRAEEILLATKSLMSHLATKISE